MKTKNKINAYILRSAAAMLLFSCVIVALSSAISLPNRPPKVPAPQNNTAFGANGHESASSVAACSTRRDRTLTFTDRVAYQRAIEEVYWQHRIWPKANADPKPPLDKVMSQAEIENKVEDYLRNSQALEDYWQRPITPDQLQAEMERIASHTKQPGVLREIFASLGNDPFVIAECLVRPVLAERLVTELYAHDQRFHGELKRRAEAELRTHRSVTHMKQTSGTYSEIEWVKSDDNKEVAHASRLPNPDVAGETPALQQQDRPNTLKLDSTDWNDNVQKLAAAFSTSRGREAAAFGVRRLDTAFQGANKPSHTSDVTRSYQTIPVGKVTRLQEDENAYYATAVVSKGKGRLKLATVAWLKEPLRSWLTRAEAQVPTTMAAVTADYTLPVISGDSDDSSPPDETSPSVACTDNTWTPTSLSNAPTPREGHTAVWTGSEMIVWGGYDNISYFNTGGRYNPTTNSWTATSTTNAPEARNRHTAVWTGSQMIVWGGVGQNYLNTGGRYNPGTDSWTATSTTNAPSGRYFHTAVWTGTQMIIWAGVNGTPTYFNTGGRYNPGSDSWTATATINAPAPRERHTAVWTGSQMIVWGGYNGSFPGLNSGGRYNPGTDSWVPTSSINAPTARILPRGVWTGSQMIVWGGQGTIYENTGGRYNPGSDSWTATSIINAPPGRWQHTAVWTGSQMIVWGGIASGIYLNTGGRYNPSSDSWTATSTAGAPPGRERFTAVWTGTQMIVWGGVNFNIGYFNTGGRYCAGAGAGGAPSPPTARAATYIASNSFTANWSSSSGATGYRLDVSTNSSFSTYVPGYQNLNVGNTTSRSVSGLSTSTTYYYRVRAYNGHGTSGNSNTIHVMTLSPTGPPVAITNPASYIASFSARLNGSVDPHGLTTTVYFQYGTTTSYGLTTAIQSKTGNTYQNVVANIGGLTPSTTYHFRLVATNSSGTRYGSDRTFTTLSATGPPVAITNPATNVASSSATLNGSVDPHGLTTTVHFQYGTTTSYGHTTANQTKTGNTYQNVAANISGLTASTRYHFRIVATNSAGTRYGSDRTFTTP
jgi:N-acetylneuraminic acid mutarotase